jgi:hypothetical protein
VRTLAPFLLGLTLLAACGPDDPLADPDAGPVRVDGGQGPADGGHAGADAGSPGDGGAPAGSGTPACVPGEGACPARPPAQVEGTYLTHYQLDVTGLAAATADLATLLRVVDAVLRGGAGACVAEGSLEARLLCLVLGVAAARAPPPPWVGQLATVLSDLFKLGASPLRASGVLTVLEQGDRLQASESWTALWATYDGQVLDLMASPVLGSAGTLTVSLPPFAGARTASALAFGPRRVDLDVNLLLVHLLDVIISAGSGGRAGDVGGLLDLLLCRPLWSSSPADALGCSLVTTAFARRFELRSRFGGLEVASQQAAIVAGSSGLRAASLGTAGSPGPLRGSLSTGLVSGPLGPFPRTSWYGVRRP